MKKRVKKQEIVTEDITVEELRNAKFQWSKIAQRGFYDDEEGIKQLKTSLRIYEDEHLLLRSKTRLCDVPELKDEVKFPVILPNDGRISQLIIMDSHEEVMHSGKESTLNRVRQNFWIIRGRQAVGKIVNNCNLCKLWRFRNVKATPLSNLPSYRVIAEYAFQS